MSKLEF